MKTIFSIPMTKGDAELWSGYMQEIGMNTSAQHYVDNTWAVRIEDDPDAVFTTVLECQAAMGRYTLSKYIA